ncbi:hypothetical protein KGF57_002361 [Candida theae]|uniref:Uncharacterized protein n=1 Tax=Candida theae TaxID=1198502 RepID=A0AAD5FZ16_9ASCO|nr:uncharacterized protein KGF57_002361 [Candida theae]KAI5958927.1 hypothetical protein KGF57_002361 [Candida theae]
MVDLRLINKHYALREQIRQLLQEDEERKNFIKLSILRLSALKRGGEGTRAKKSTRGSPSKPAVNSATKDYEIELNKLKQEYSTKSKLHDAKLQSLRQENERLKAQVRKLNSDGSSSSISKLQPKKRNLPSHRSIFSPEKFSSISSKSSTSRHLFPTIFDDELITPIKKIPETKLVSDLMKSVSAKSPTKVAKFQDSGSLADDFAIPNATSSPTGSSKFRSPTKFVNDFENDGNGDNHLSRRRSPSPDFTPNRRPRVLRSTGSSAPGEEKAEKSPSARNTNASVEHSGSPIKSERRVKKVRKRKLLDIPSLVQHDESESAFPDADEESINTLAKYEDAHFEENLGANDTSNNSLKRKLDFDGQVLDPEPPKKRRNVFKID